MLHFSLLYITQSCIALNMRMLLNDTAVLPADNSLSDVDQDDPS
jgi:hypothetical protein